ncbi:aspartate aminotransferase family protein [Variovorax terrae]|uniref:Diaminobutyrate--2-oxoglutarate transaminase n=1 Tax=Variovorax terrae TaxID=2923278 RepID=A0A9X1VTB6_9BURK|nr:aspartate aminotransferase family protein [Variovorax terrae]MCJ0763481.1 aspartate aminotransferase family protein [Variovorax terrae]
MTHLFHRQLRQTLPEAASAKGLYITDTAGKTYLDACGGAAVSCLGHNHPDVIAAMAAQMARLDYAHTSFFTTRVAEELADTLIAQAPEGISHVYLLSSGSEAMEAALKMARQYFVELGQPRRTNFIARRQSYHGNTLGALAVGGNAWRRAQFAPLLIDVTHVAPCYEYRDRLPTETPEQYGQRLVRELEAELLRLGPDTVIGICAEPVVGATLGAAPPVPGYFQGIRALCDRYGVLLIADEVMCGMGRTGTLHALEQEGIVPDIMAVAKGLGGGYQAIGAVLAHGRVYDAFDSGSGQFMHGHTYIGHPVACAAALEVQRVLQREKLVEASRVQGLALRRKLDAALGGHAHVGDIRGRGLFLALELVADRASKQPFDPKLRLNGRIRDEALARGLMVYAMGGTIDGRHGDHVLLAPPFTVQERDLDTLVERLAESVEAALAGLPA